MEKKQGMFMELEKRNEITEILIYELCGGSDKVDNVSDKAINSNKNNVIFLKQVEKLISRLYIQ